MKAKIADAFLERFQLKPEESKALRVGKGINVTEVGVEIYRWNRLGLCLIEVQNFLD